MSKAPKPEPENPLSAKEAAALIAAIRSSALITALKDPDFAMVVAVALHGFRVDTNALANTVVRQRLAAEAARNPLFGEKLKELAIQFPISSSQPRKPAAVVATPAAASSLTSTSAPLAPDRSTEKYRDERDRLRRELTEEAERRRVAEKALGEAKIDALAASASRTDADQEALRQKQRAERLERKLRRLELENAQLRRLAGTSAAPTGQPAAPVADTQRTSAYHRSSVQAQDSPFIDAVRHLLDKQRWPAARAIADDVLRSAPANEDALAIRAAASDGLGDARAAQQDMRSLVAAQIGRADMAAAARSLAQLFAMPAELTLDIKIAREFYAALAQLGGPVDDVREIFDSLKRTSPAAYETLKSAAQGEAASALFAARPTRRVSADDTLAIALAPGLPRAVTGRLAVGWVDRNETTIVDALRSAMEGLEEDTRSRLAAALESAADGDTSYFRLLSRRVPTGPVVVDASNVAWADQEMLASRKPRLRQVLAVRKALRDKGYFPIFLIADANFPLVVDDSAAARKLVADGCILLSTGGSDADVLILQEARRLGAPVVSNDFMADWDPDQEIRKLQCSFAPTSGEVTLYE